MSECSKVSKRDVQQASADATHQHSGITGFKPDILKDFVIGRIVT